MRSISKKQYPASRKLASLLRRVRFKATPARLSVLAALGSSKQPLSALGILKSIGRSRLDKVTAYRTLNSLSREGVIRRIDLHHGHAHYELVKKDHHHLICTNCSRIEDIGDCTLPSLTKKILARSSFSKITDHSLEFFGICKTCKGKA